MSFTSCEWRLPDRVLSVGRRPLVMGIVNVTPDSFSDGSQFVSTEAAVAHGLQLVEQGADLLDIGGESSRPGAVPVPLEEEQRRVVPVVERLAAKTTVPLSVDTYKAEVARACLAGGAHIVNDITAMTGDSRMPELVRSGKAGVILMHMQGSPATMQLNPQYQDVVGEIIEYLRSRLQTATELGIAAEQIVLDPGIGFGKQGVHNLELLARLEEFQRLGRPVCLGVSRKGILGKVLRRPVERRLAGSLAAVCYVLAHGAVQVIRVHDVEETRDAVDLFEAITHRGQAFGTEAGPTL
jgi:dihydropteroate synthase